MRSIFNPKVVVAALLIAVFLLCASLVYILLERPGATAAGTGGMGAGLTIIPGPSSTPRPIPPTPTPIPPTPMDSPTPGPGEVAVGVYVQPNTEGAGLRIHTSPSLASDFFGAYDSEVFLVTKGPQTADNYTWWYLSAPYDSQRAGWAVQDYLRVIPKPANP